MRAGGGAPCGRRACGVYFRSLCSDRVCCHPVLALECPGIPRDYVGREHPVWYRTCGAHGPRPRAEGVTVSSAQGRGARVRPRTEGVTVSSARGHSVKWSIAWLVCQPGLLHLTCHVAACGINGVGPYYSTQDGATSYLRILGEARTALS